MKFVLGKAEAVREQLKGFGPYYFKVFTSPSVSLLVLCLNDDDLIAACSIGGRFNLSAVFVKDQCRGQGIATQIFKTMIGEAQKRGINFISGTPDTDHLIMLHILYKLGFRLVFSLKEFVLVMLPLNFKGKLVYAFLLLVSRSLPGPFVTKAYYTAVWIYRRTLSRGP